MIELVAVAGFVAFCSAMFFLVWAANRDKVPARTSGDASGGFVGASGADGGSSSCGDGGGGSC
jgi:hypothetical protein